MKKTVLLMTIAFGLLFIWSCNNSESNNSGLNTDVVKNPNTATQPNAKKGWPKMEFEKTIYNFGRVIEGEKVGVVFKFKNVGESDLVITNAKATCGCTIPEYSKEPIPVGGEGKIEVKFDSKNREGFQRKSVTIMSNGKPSTVILNITADVYKPENE